MNFPYFPVFRHYDYLQKADNADRYLFGEIIQPLTPDCIYFIRRSDNIIITTITQSWLYVQLK